MVPSAAAATSVAVLAYPPMQAAFSTKSCCAPAVDANNVTTRNPDAAKRMVFSHLPLATCTTVAGAAAADRNTAPRSVQPSHAANLHAIITAMISRRPSRPTKSDQTTTDDPMTDERHAPDDAVAANLSPTLQSRYDQMFPSLTPQEIERLRRFGSIRRYADGERLFGTGEVGRGMFVIISGHVAITQRDGLGHITPVADQGPGQFLAEVGTLSGRAALVDGHAEGDVEALAITPENLRRLLVAEAE